MTENHQSQHNNEQNQAAPSIFLCLDLEATTKADALLTDMEAIELGVVAVSEDGEVVSTFQSFIKPRYTQLTEYATAIHCITQHDLENAGTLPEVMKRLSLWLADLPTTPTCWYSWGNYDKRQLELDTGPQRWHISLPLPEHRNAKKLFQKRQFRKGKQVGLNKALDLMGLTFQGQHHSALDDARNVARLFEYFHQQKTTRHGNKSCYQL